MGCLPIVRSEVRLTPDPRRVVTRPFVPGGLLPIGTTRAASVIERILAMSPDDVTTTLHDVRARFDRRHPDLDEILDRGFDMAAHWLPDGGTASVEARHLIGAYFTHEYAIEAAALTNPSIVQAPDQSGAADGSLDVVVSLRAIGEGHISSIEFRTGSVGRDGQVRIDPALQPAHGERTSPMFERAMFRAKLQELEADVAHTESVLGRLADRFTLTELEQSLEAARIETPGVENREHTDQSIHWLATSNYTLAFAPDTAISQRVVFPAGPAESRGMEDARFVRFERPDGEFVYHATYTAYDGFHILPQLITTEDFTTFRIATLNGPAVRNKGIALFPRLVGGRYAALGRPDNESTYLLRSDHVRFWHDNEPIQVPRRPWELIQIGNCGSPIETPAGWLVITHGVGPMRTYVLGAALLDLEDPSRVLGVLRDPLLEPDEDERDGYVPNVVYSCGSLVHDDWLVMAYGASDTSSRFASTSLDALLGELTSPRSRATPA
jgi:predicted GH43/DUF377 family glycosyl hydrolase